MITFVQPFGLHSPGGGPRILRALLEEAPRPFLSICTLPKAPPPTHLGREIHLRFRPQFGRMESTRFAPWLSTPFPLYQCVFARKLERVLRSREAAAVHCIPQGLDFWLAELLSTCRKRNTANGAEFAGAGRSRLWLPELRERF